LTQRFQILALDGGGIKGLFSAAILAHIEEDLRIRVTDYFDLIVGTSTGGIIALGLGLGLRPREIVDFYADQGPKIFRDWFGLRRASHWFVRKFPQRSLCEALRSVFSDKTLGDSEKPLVIPSYNLGEDDIYLFKTPHHTRLTRDWKTPAWQVALATSAAPTFFPPSRYVNGIRHVDGGLWANNPTLVGITEAVSMFSVALSDVSVLSLGTSDAIVRRPKRLNWGGKAFWASAAVDLVLRAQSKGVYTQSLHLIGGKNILRLDPKVPDGLFTLDNTSRAEELRAKAAHESRILCPDLEQRFLNHTARPYVPCYPKM